MTATSNDDRIDELSKDYDTAANSYSQDLADAGKIKDSVVRAARQSEIKSNYYKLKAAFFHAQTVDLEATGALVESAFAAAVAARVAIEGATGDEKDLVSRIGRMSTLANAAAELMKKASGG